MKQEIVPPGGGKSYDGSKDHVFVSRASSERRAGVMRDLSEKYDVFER